MRCEGQRINICSTCGVGKVKGNSEVKGHLIRIDGANYCNHWVVETATMNITKKE